MEGQIKKELKELLKLARNAIASELEGKDFVVDERIKKMFSNKQACFVTLKKNGRLRGCVGSLIAKQELWKDVIQNAKNAAFYDPRFMPLQKHELEDTKIEISILSTPKKITYNSQNELKRKIKGKGVIIAHKLNCATFLPQVWQELKDEEEFLSYLCLKAGLPADFWKQNKLSVSIYEIEKISE